jgi:hypothetical protein
MMPLPIITVVVFVEVVALAGLIVTSISRGSEGLLDHSSDHPSIALCSVMAPLLWSGADSRHDAHLKPVLAAMGKLRGASYECDPTTLLTQLRRANVQRMSPYGL